ncbi:hypothetical protein V6N12_038687 [Hibiscus sabdariffa]|uniref:RNase H type-1 domain-containing protein n=1 Tax=Hibiscus sabdariffa TaxID=183260 RepID=A0ABR2CAJ4_9ROSI
MEFKRWIFVNLSNVEGFSYDQVHWDILFGSLFWCLWKKQNEWILCDQDRYSEPILQRGMRLQQEAAAVRSTKAAIPLRGTILANVRWHKPQPGWCKLNVGGSVGRATGLATCGGVVRNKEGTWLIGFSRKLGICSILEAELWGLYEGLLTAWSIGIRFLLIESDCLEAVNLIAKRDSLLIVPSIIYYIAKLLNRAWSVKLSYWSEW